MMGEDHGTLSLFQWHESVPERPNVLGTIFIPRQDGTEAVNNHDLILLCKKGETRARFIGNRQGGLIDIMHVTVGKG
jgi:hypothetical protein